MEKSGTAGNRPVLALTGGDPNGIGPEICLKAAGSRAVRAVCRPVLVGDPEVFDFYRKKYRLGVTIIESDPGDLPPDRRGIPVISINLPGKFHASPGRMSTRSGRIAGLSVELAVSLCRTGFAEALVTGPLSKSNLNGAGFRYPGQTEMVAHLSGSGPPLMLLVNGRFRVGLVTAHVPLRKVASLLTVGGVACAIRALHTSLVTDFRIRRPTIAVLGLNPHAGESGTLGDEEKEIIGPAIRSLRKRTPGVSGPFPADGFFATRCVTGFDGIVAMYHDQGLIPLKMDGFASVVNISAGLSVVRTSPGHGTAFDLAGRGTADPSSMVAAVLAAVRICRNRRMPLKTVRIRSRR